MNPDKPSREEIEAKLTALLLGELPDEEARLLRWAIAQDAGLAKLHDQLKRTIGLVRVVSVKPAESDSEKDAALKLSDERREKLLAHFKTPRPAPKELFWLKRLEIHPLVTTLALVAIVAVAAALLLPATAKSKRAAMRASMSGRANASIENLRQKDAAISEWALENKKSSEVAATPPPVVVSVSPEPTLAPPPVEIVLPATEATLSRDQNVATAQLQNGDPHQVAQSLQIMLANPRVSQNSAPQQRAQNSAITTRSTTTSSGIAGRGVGAVAFGGGGGAGGFGGFGGSGRGGGNTGGSISGANVPAEVVADSARRTAGSLPDSAVLERVPQAGNDQAAAGTLVQDGKLLYEMGKFKEAEDKLNQALKVDPNNQGAFYYLSLDKQANFASEENSRTTQGADRMVQVAKAWSPDVGAGLPVPNPNSSTVPPIPTDTTLALNDSDADRWRTENQANNRWSVGSILGPVANSGDITTPQNRGEEYRNPSGETGTDKTPLLGDLPVAGRMFAGSVAAPITAPAPPSTPATVFYSFDGTINAPLVSEDGSEKLQKSGSGTLSFDTPATTSGKLSSDQMITGGLRNDRNGEALKAELARRPSRQILAESTHRLDGDTINSPAPALVVAPVVAPPGDVPQFAFAITNAVAMNSGVSHDDVNGLRSLLDANPNSIAPSPTLTQQQLQSYSNRAEAERSQPYWESKRKLENMIDFHKLLQTKIASAELDLKTPTTSMVTVIDQAQSAQSQNLWQNLTGKVESKARIQVHPDSGDITSMGGTPAASSYLPYDSYFVQTELEAIQSDAVLGKVVDALKLDEVWAKNSRGEKLDKKEAIALLKKRLDLKPEKNTKLIDIGATSDKPDEAGKIANAVAEAYQNYLVEKRGQLTAAGIKTLQAEVAKQEEQIRLAQAEVDRLAKETNIAQPDQPLPKPPPNAPIPQPEIQTSDNAFSTFSLNVSDVSFKLAEASLQKGQMPDAASIRSEEFINAFDYRDPEAAAGQPVAFTSERARYPFAHNRDLLRFSVKTAAAGRQAGRALNLVLLIDNSGSMERADRVAIIREALRVLATQLQPQDTVSVVTFARTARLWADGVSGDKAGETLEQVGGITPEGGTNLEEAMRLAYETARRHYLANGMNRVVLLTDGAANLGNVDPGALKQKVEANRKQGIALDCFGIGWEGFNDDLLEQLSSNGDGRYAFLNSPEDAANEFAAKLAGALQVAASDVKVQVEFNPQRVISWRQIGYARHQLTKEQFRDNAVDAAEIAALEAGNALYTVETKPDGTGPVATVRVRYKVPGTTDYREQSWDVPYAGNAVALEQSSPAMRLAATASAFSEWLASSPFAQEVTPDELLKDLSGVPQIYGADPRPKQLEWMIRQAKSLSGK